MQVDIYDFDHTLFPMDSGSRFFGYCMLHYPWILVFAPFQIIMALLLFFFFFSFTLLKKYFFKASECLFLDDRKDNVVAASNLGFETIEVKDSSKVIDLIKEKISEV